MNWQKNSFKYILVSKKKGKSLTVEKLKDIFKNKKIIGVRKYVRYIKYNIIAIEVKHDHINSEWSKS